MNCLMNNKRYFKIAVALTAAAALIFACTVKVKEIILPAHPTTDNVEEIHVLLDMANGTGHNNTPWIFAVLLPKEWNAKSNATATYSTDGLTKTSWWTGTTTGRWAGEEIVDGTMSLVTADDKETISKATWPDALMAKFGTMGNFYDMEWVVFKSDDLFNLGEDNDNHTIIDVTFKVKTGSERISFWFAAMYGTMEKGLQDDPDWGNRYASPIKEKMTLEGEGDLLDYAIPPLTSMTPSVFSYEDIVCVNFSSKAGDVESVLNGLTDVYLCGKVVLDNGDELTVDEGAPRMTNVSGYQYKQYIYPRAFFKVPDQRTIKNMYFWFRNADGSKVEDADGALFSKPAKGTPLN